MATATLENINPYSKYGLKRRPTYNEIIGLIGENDTLTGELPNRDATFFKASPEGSFFDGLDHLEILKEEQNRIHERQMRELLMRQNLGGRTYHAERLRDQMRTNEPPQPVTERDRDLTDAQMQTELQRRMNQTTNRTQQTGQAHQGFLSRVSSASTPSVVRRIFDLSIPSLSRASSRAKTPQLQQPQPRDGRVTPAEVNHPDLFVIGGSSESEDEMHTARAGKEDLIMNSLRFRNPEATNADLVRVVDVLKQYTDLAPEQIATDFSNFAILNNIYSALLRNGIITDDVYEQYQNITGEISKEKAGRKRARLLRNLAEHYRDNVYDVYIDDISNRPVGA